MLQPRISSQIRPIIFAFPRICTQCRSGALQPHKFRTFTSAPALRAASTKDDEPEFIPRTLGRPIGFPEPPSAGIQLFPTRSSKPSTPEPLRSRTTWKESFKQRNLEKRKVLVEKWGKSYFADFKNIRKYRDGKTFMANQRIFRRDASLYFPNFVGETLQKGVAAKGTTEVLRGKVSVVNVYSSRWGEMQVQTFTGKTANPELHGMLREHKEVAQMVDVNIEENPGKAWIVKFLMWKLRQQKSEEEQGRYFLVRSGVTDYLRETIGLLNGRVGYVYLVDQDCKIRWAGSANAEGQEMEYLNKGVTRLIEDHKKENSSRPKAIADVEEELEAQAINAGAS
ncbi:ATP10 protein-domain-containing protein [Clohesyomyces aquaticus]|uniref:ATP10 protein-domain-containing protein n=1 Tax=Clohesyomyces aquaticus TaxID=1231657 RepID=A0A1Y1Y5R5_9PLEO|nr:ATP10 protein-domain-containing protein [Clohesyomyces aquaticus]